MKKHVLMMIAALTIFTTGANAETILNCHRNDYGYDYHATIKVGEEHNSSVFLGASNNKATARHEQSFGPVGKQTFYENSSNGITLTLQNPIRGTSYDADVDFATVEISEHNYDENYSVTLIGSSLTRHNPRTFGRLTFIDCSLNH